MLRGMIQVGHYGMSLVYLELSRDISNLDILSQNKKDDHGISHFCFPIRDIPRIFQTRNIELGVSMGYPWEVFLKNHSRDVPGYPWIPKVVQVVGFLDD